MLCVFVCSPYKSTTSEAHEENVAYAQQALVDSLGRSEAPFAPHLLYPQVLIDADELDRNVAMAAGKAWLEVSDVLAVYTDLGISGGMEEEIAWAEDNMVTVEYRTLTPEEGDLL
jgi:hypothetical protein